MLRLSCGYSGKEKDSIRVSASLDIGWKNLGKSWGFDETDYLDYDGDSKFRCRLRLVEKAPTTWASRAVFHERYLDDPFRVGDNFVSLHGLRLQVDVPLSQDWSLTNDSNRRPSIYVMDEDVFCVDTSDGAIHYRLQLWIVLHGRSQMFVKAEHEWGDGFAWVGGRPESNRRKF